MMKKHILLLTAQIFLVNSLFVAPAHAGWLDRFKRKAKASSEQVSAPQQLEAPEVKIQSYTNENVKMIRLQSGTQVFDFSEESLASAIQEHRNNNGMQLPKELLATLPPSVLEVVTLTQNYIPDEVFGVMAKKGQLLVNGQKAPMPSSPQAPQAKPTAAAESAAKPEERSAQDTATAQNKPVDDSLSFRSPLSPESPQGSTVDVDMSFSQVDADNDGKAETVAKAESVKIEQTTEAQRKIIHEQFKPSEIRKLLAQDRRDLVKKMVSDRLDEIRRAKNMQPVPAWQKTTWGAQTRRFPMETVMFFISIGLINGGMLINDFAQNPLIMDQHLQTLTDPIGHMSFYSFMIVNGYATEFLTSGAMANKAVTDEMMKAFAKNPTSRVAMAAALKTNDPRVFEKLLNEIADEAGKMADRKGSLNPYSNSVAKKAYMKIVPYLGMSAGSMASHITGDFLRTLQSCVTSLYKDPKMLKEQGGSATAQKVKDRLNGLSEDACDVAWREWVMEKKFNTYAPALVSMVLSTMGSGAITALAGKVRSSSPYTSIAEAMSKSKQAVLGKLRLEGAEIGTSVISGLFGGVWTKTMKFITHLSSITVFTALDTAIHGWVEDKVLNFSMGYYYLWPNIDAFPRKAEILNILITKESAEKFQKDSVSCEKDLTGADCRRNDIEGWLYDFSQAMMKWREFNQTKAKQAHMQWVDKINKYQDMERFSKSFYESFVKDLKNSNVCMNNKDECGKIKDATRSDGDILDSMEEGGISTNPDLLRFLNYRQYPLYGVNPDPSVKLGEGKKWKDNYMDNPAELQEAQQVTVHKVAADLEAYLNRKGLDSSDLKNHKDQLIEIIAGLKSADLMKNGTAINTMRTLSSASKGNVNEVVQAILREHLNKMGYPAPLLFYGQGFPYAFESHEANKELVKRVELPEFYRNVRLSTQFRFEKKTDYLYYYMLCGPNAEKGQAVSDNTLGNVYGYGMLGFRDLFIPPRIVSDNLKLDICSDKLKFDSSGSLYTQWIIDEAKNQKYAGAFNVIDKNLTAEMKNITTSTQFELEEKDAQKRAELLKQPLVSMSDWWEKYVENQVSRQLETFKVQYESIAVKFLEAQFKDVGTLLGLPLHSSIVRNSVVTSALQESRVYSLVLAEVLRNNLPAETVQKLYTSNKLADDMKSTYKKQMSPSDIVTLQARPFQQDLNSIKTGAAPRLFKFQLMNEEILSSLYWAIKNAEVVNKPDFNGKDRAVVDLKMDEKQVDALEKKIDESLKAMSEEIDNLAKQIKVAESKGERAKPLRIIEFTKNQMNQIARELVATLSTIQFARNAALEYSLKDNPEEKKRLAEKAQREQKRKDCIKTKSAAGVTGGGGC